MYPQSIVQYLQQRSSFKSCAAANCVRPKCPSWSCVEDNVQIRVLNLCVLFKTDFKADLKQISCRESRPLLLLNGGFSPVPVSGSLPGEETRVRATVLQEPPRPEPRALEPRFRLQEEKFRSETCVLLLASEVVGAAAGKTPCYEFPGEIRSL